MSKKKSIIKNYIYNLSYQILILILPLVTTPYLSKVLGAEGIGTYSYTLSITAYFILFGSLGVAMYGQREIAYNQEKMHERTITFFEILIMRFITMSISMIIFYISFCRNLEYTIYYRILLLEILASSVDISWFFQGLEEFKKTVTRNMIVKFISVIAIFIFVKDKSNLNLYFWIYVISILLGNLSLWLYLPKFICKPNFKELKVFKHLKPTLKLFIPQIAVQIYTVVDKTMIGKILNDMNEVGFYEQSQKIVKIALTAVTALSTVVSPRIANTVANKNKEELIKYLKNSFKFVWLLGMPIMVGIMSISVKLVPWFLGNQFEKCSMLIIIGAPLIMAIGLNNVSGVQYLIASKQENIFSKSVIIGAIFNFCLNLVMIQNFKSIGAIISSVLAETLILIIQLVYIRRQIPLNIIYKNNIKYIFASSIMGIIVYFFGNLFDSKIIITLLQVILGGSVYVISLILMKDEFIKDFIIKIKNKVIGEKYEKS